MSLNLSLSFRFLGHPLSIRVAWLFAVAFAVGYLLVQLAPNEAGALERVGWYVQAAAITAGAALSILLHEAAHATVAQRIGAPVVRVRLYPLGSVEQGFADPGTPIAEAVGALAGPVVSGALGLALFGLQAIVPRSAGPLHDILWYLAIGNLVLAGVNLLPGLPLDGGRVLRSLVWFLHDSYGTGTRVAASYGRLIGTFGLAAGLVLLGLESRWSALGVLIVVASWGMNRAGREEERRSFLLIFGASVSAGDLVVGMNPHVRADQLLDETLDVLLAEMHSGPGLVIRHERVVGVLGLEQLRHFPRSDWHRRTAGDAMIAIERLPQLDAAMNLRDVLDYLSTMESNLLVVTRENEVIGALDRRLALQRLFERSRAQQRPLPRRRPY
jgi:Zn-dependent protease